MRLTRRSAWIAGALAMAFIPIGAGSATLYKWTDASGRVVYSDQPPPANVKSEILKGPPPPANPNAAKDLANKELEYKQRQLEKAEASAKADKDAAAAKQRADDCTQLKGDMQTLASDLPLYRVNEKGERVAMDDAARRAERERLGKWMREHCAG